MLVPGIFWVLLEFVELLLLILLVYRFQLS